MPIPLTVCAHLNSFKVKLSSFRHQAKLISDTLQDPFYSRHALRAYDFQKLQLMKHTVSRLFKDMSLKKDTQKVIISEVKSVIFVPQCSRNSSWKELSSSWISSGQGQSSPALKFNSMLICRKQTNKL